MSYLTIISLDEAKNYLRIDDTLTEDNANITRMINGALSFIERWTNVLVFAREKTYLLIDGFVRVYDAPINSITSPTEADMTNEQRTLYKNFCHGSETADLVLNVGHVSPSTVPQELIEVAYEIIDIMYYEHETGKTIKKDLSGLSKDILNQNKRFIF